MSTPAAAKASRIAAGSPPGMTGPFQPCGSPRKNWAASAPRAIASFSGLSTWKWAPMRTIHPSLVQRSGGEAALGQDEGQPDEPGDDAGDDQDPLLAGGRDHLHVQPDQARGQPGGGRNDDHGGPGVGIPDDQAQDEGYEADDQGKDGQDILDRMRLPVRVQDVRTRAGPDAACHGDHLLAVTP